MIVNLAAGLSLALCALGQGENLLENPGFETVVAGVPANWSVFVLPMAGAEGRVDYEASADGLASVMLHTPRPYADDPANNWSQHILLDLTGANLIVSALIKTKDATAASILVQCSQRSPYRIISSATTHRETPFAGTQDWTPVETAITVPPGTDFVTVRCVLEGAGTAWFDGLSVTETPSPEAMADAVSNAPEKKKGAASQDHITTKELLEVNAALRDTVRSLRELNDSVAVQLQRNQEELRRLREELDALRETARTLAVQRDDAAREPERAILAPIEPIPPLVPGRGSTEGEGE
jgi:hypothetical protein